MSRRNGIIKTFGHQKYYRASKNISKREATRLATRVREGGEYARVVKLKGRGYATYVRGSH